MSVTEKIGKIYCDSDFISILTDELYSTIQKICNTLPEDHLNYENYHNNIKKNTDLFSYCSMVFKY